MFIETVYLLQIGVQIYMRSNIVALRWTIILFSVFFAGLVTLGLVAFLRHVPKHPPYARGACYSPPGGKPPYTPGVPYLYQAPPDRQAAILSGWPQLKIGMTRREVRNIMGDPDVDKPAYKPTLAHPNSGEYVGIFWDYIIRSAEPDGGNVNDNVIGVSFTADDQLNSVYDSRSRKLP